MTDDEKKRREQKVKELLEYAAEHEDQALVLYGNPENMLDGEKNAGSLGIHGGGSLIFCALHWLDHEAPEVFNAYLKMKAFGMLGDVLRQLAGNAEEGQNQEPQGGQTDTDIDQKLKQFFDDLHQKGNPGQDQGGNTNDDT